MPEGTGMDNAQEWGSRGVGVNRNKSGRQKCLGVWNHDEAEVWGQSAACVFHFSRFLPLIGDWRTSISCHLSDPQGHA